MREREGKKGREKHNRSWVGEVGKRSSSAAASFLCSKTTRRGA
jgi:hypothetical protein